MRRSPVLRRCCFVVTVLSLSLVDAQWLNVKHYTSQQSPSLYDDQLPEFEGSTDERKADHLNIKERVQSLLKLLQRHRDSSENEQRKLLRKNKLTVAVQNNLKARLGKITYFLRLNAFADWFDDEYAALLGTKLPTNRLVPPFMVGTRSTKKNTTDWMNETTSLEHLPATLDWTAHGWVTPASNQGNCASCWAFAACGAMEAQLYNLTGVLRNLSAQNIVDCSPPLDADGCKGGVIQWAFDYVTANDGINTDKVYPYVGKQSHKCQFKHNAKLTGIIQSWVDMPIGNETAMLLALKMVGPLAAAVDARPVSFQMYSGGIYASSDCSTSINHGVLIVGYGTQNTSDGDLPYWIIKNSWGTSWGIDGYMLIARNVNMCGIALSATYPAI